MRKASSYMIGLWLGCLETLMTFSNRYEDCLIISKERIISKNVWSRKKRSFFSYTSRTYSLICHLILVDVNILIVPVSPTLVVIRGARGNLKSHWWIATRVSLIPLKLHVPLDSHSELRDDALLFYACSPGRVSGFPGFSFTPGKFVSEFSRSVVFLGRRWVEQPCGTVADQAKLL